MEKEDIPQFVINFILKQKGNGYSLNKGQKDLAELLYLENMEGASTLISKYQKNEELYLLGLTERTISDLMFQLHSLYQTEGIDFFFSLIIHLKPKQLDKFVDDFVFKISTIDSAYSIATQRLQHSSDDINITKNKLLLPLIDTMTALSNKFQHIENKILLLKEKSGELGEIAAIILHKALEQKIMITDTPSKNKMKI